MRPSLTLEEARTTASWSAIAGGLNSNSDWLPDLPAERLDIIRRTMPSHGKTARPVDLFENDPPRLWTVTDETNQTRRDVIALFNWHDAGENFAVPTSRFGLPPAHAYVGFDYWANAFMEPFSDRLTASLPAHGCKIIAVRPLLEHPFLLSTSRHVTQGMTDITAETWSGAALSGESRVVGGDPYELRIYAPALPHLWKVSHVAVSPGDKAGGTQIHYTQNGPEIRVSVTSPQSRVVHWKAIFQ